MNLKEKLFFLRSLLVKNNQVKNEERDSDVIDENVSTKNNQGSEEELSFIDFRYDDKFLEKATLEFFPKTGEWYSNCFERSNKLYMSNLPCHLRDSKWLASMFRNNQKLFMFTPFYIQQYVENSKVFNDVRHNYELEIVKWQINYMALGGEGWIIDEDLGGDFFLLSPTADLAFRKGIVDTLTKIGMDKEVVEEGIEKYASAWRDCYMERAFSNEFNSVFLSFDFSLLGGKKAYTTINKPVLADIDPEFKKAWLDLRKYEYYQRHKDSVDKYGVVLPEMQLNLEEEKRLKLFVSEKTKERKEEIKRYKKQIDDFNGKSYVKSI